MSYVFEPAPRPSVAVAGSDQRFPVHRIYCVARNYAAHAREMGMSGREPPFFFCKPADGVVDSGATVAYPPQTEDLHHEIELVVAICRPGGRIEPARALEHVYGYAVGNDLTRRDLQRAARKQGRPWDTAKGFEQCAPISAIVPVAQCGHPRSGRLWLRVNDEVRQQADLSDMIWSVPEIIAELSTLFTLAAGDLIYTGTPAGVAALEPGDRLRGGIAGIGELETRIGPSR